MGGRAGFGGERSQNGGEYLCRSYEVAYNNSGVAQTFSKLGRAHRRPRSLACLSTHRNVSPNPWRRGEV